MLKIWTPSTATEEHLPAPFLRIAEEGSTTRLNAVSRAGVKIASLAALDHSGVHSLPFAKTAIEQHGHSVDWAKWGENGEFVGYKEESK